MENVNNIEEAIEHILLLKPHKIVFSNAVGASITYRKIVISQKQISGKDCYQIESFTEKQAFHKNIELDQLKEYMLEYADAYKQINAFSAEAIVDVKISKKKKVLYNRRKGISPVEISGNNKKKKYILYEGLSVPPLVDLGVLTADGKIVNSMYDKYKQINRFLEMVDDVIDMKPGDRINVIDFGCGKSYLTFVLYYYLVEIKQLDAHITGLDLKEEVIKKCNEISAKYNYENLHFQMGDINGYKCKEQVDMVVTLHACDTATDYALYNAIGWNTRIILSVPCCQHEINGQIESEKLNLLLKYGIIKERTSALITDAIRGGLLEYSGYDTKLLEFIDISHSPKNILIRAVRKGNKPNYNKKALIQVEQLMEEFSLYPTLYKLLIKQ